jgi:hypothetical protein
VSVLDLVVIIGVVAGRGVRPSFAGPRPGELQRSAVATERAASELGWVCSFAGVSRAGGRWAGSYGPRIQSQLAQ